MDKWYTRTEFWASLAVALLGAFLASDLLPDTHIAVKLAGMAMAVLSALGYTVGRSYVKAKRPAPPIGVNDMAKIVGPVMELFAAKKVAPAAAKPKPKKEASVVVDDEALKDTSKEDVEKLFDEAVEAKPSKPEKDEKTEKPIIKKSDKKET